MQDSYGQVIEYIQGACPAPAGRKAVRHFLECNSHIQCLTVLQIDCTSPLMTLPRTLRRLSRMPRSSPSRPASDLPGARARGQRRRKAVLRCISLLTTPSFITRSMQTSVLSTSAIFTDLQFTSTRSLALPRMPIVLLSSTARQTRGAVPMRRAC